MRKPKPASALAVMAFCLAACGKSTDARRMEAVKCSAFFQGLTVSQLAQGGVPESFMQAIDAKAAGHPSSDQGKLLGLTSLGDSLTAQLDGAKVQAAQQDGVQDLVRLAKANDAAGAVSYLDGCVDNRDRLLESAR